MPKTQAARRLRLCDICGGLDDHPRHVIGVPAGHPGAVPSREFLDSLPDAPASAVADMLSPTMLQRHHDCCAAQGCQVCKETEEINGGKRGQDLIDAILGGSLDDHEPASDMTNKELGLDG